MDPKTINQKPRISDEILFTLETPDSDGCFNSNPYRIDNIQIIYLERNFYSNFLGEITDTIATSEQLERLKEASELACAYPTSDNLIAIENIQSEITNSAYKKTYFYSNASIIEKIGNDSEPAWLSTIPNESVILNIPKDSDGNYQYGVFEFLWKPYGQREGDYYITWTWTVNSGDTQKITARQYFSLLGDTRITTSSPKNRTVENKYHTLLERYTPTMYKEYLTNDDLTPEVIKEFNNSIADAFTFLEDLTNQMLDMINANATKESFLSALANNLGVYLRTNDPTLWRRQIKNGIPLFKKKGTLESLEEAFLQSQLKLNNFTRLYQVKSKYTYQESFNVELDGQTSFTLSNNIVFESSLTPDSDNIEIYYRGKNDDAWTILYPYLSVTPDDLISFVDDTNFEWVNSTLFEGDSIKIIYEITEVPVSEQTIEEYIRTLPLADLRDERDQTYPLKNWNIRVIEKDDPLFDLVIPLLHPFTDPVIFGHVRTEIPYSENIYNMEEYNGSLRVSYDPCDIDRYFLDECKDCLGSMYNLDIEIENLSDDRLVEARDIINDFTPFHSVLHSLSFTGIVNEIIPSPVEQINILVQFLHEELVLLNSQLIFNRAMEIQQEDSEISLQGTFTLGSNQVTVSGDVTTEVITGYFIWLNSDGMGHKQRVVWVEYNSGITTIILENIYKGVGGTGTFTRRLQEKTQFTRSDLANSSIVFTSTTNGTIKNTAINLFDPVLNLEKTRVQKTENLTYLEILSGTHAGTYTVSNANGHLINVSSIIEPLSQEPFSYRLSNKLLENTSSSITQDNYYTFSDSNIDFIDLDIKTQWDVENNDSYSGGAYRIYIPSIAMFPSATYDILKINVDGNLVIRDDGTLPSSNLTGQNYYIINDTTTSLPSSYTGITGILTVKHRAKVTISGSSSVKGEVKTVENIKNLIGNYSYDEISINCTFSNDSEFITYASDISNEIGVGDYIYLESDGESYAERVIEITEDTIELADKYKGTSATGSTIRKLNTNQIKFNFYLMYDGNQYKINGFVEGESKQFYIDDYNSGNAAGTIIIYDRIIDSNQGQLNYEGLVLVGTENHENNLNIQNGINLPSIPLENNSFKENYLILIGTDYYAISEIDSNTITLSGPFHDYTLTGTSTSYSIIKYSKLNPDVILAREKPYVPSSDFDILDRRGNIMIDLNSEQAQFSITAQGAINLDSQTYYDETVSTMMLSMLNNNNENIDTITQSESISLNIEYKEEE